jgi:metal-sulfur cluster biosynthetic enzyme
MSKNAPLRPAHPERVCWGCDLYCPADDLACGNGSERTPHPIELFGDDWQEWSQSLSDSPDDAARSRAFEALRSVIDPELGINIVDLGLVYRIDVEGSLVRVALTMTSPACPLGEQLVARVKERLKVLRGIERSDVELVWDPPWTPERMSAAARSELGLPEHGS